MKDTLEHCKEWIGKTETIRATLDPFQARAVAAMLDAQNLAPQDGTELPPLWQWFYFLATEPQGRLGPDGHPERGGFMPPVPLPRRMFAGSRMTFHRALIIGRPALREGLIKDVVVKTGKSGTLVFVTVLYRYVQDGVTCISEEQDIVYREPGAPVTAPPEGFASPPPAVDWTRDMRADSRLLFRFSALTFNAHRIHYDRPYAQHEEGYPGLIVHGPLTAILLADLIRRHDSRSIATFNFRGKAPVFDLAPFRLCGTLNEEHVTLEASRTDGVPALVAQATLSHHGAPVTNAAGNCA